MAQKLVKNFPHLEALFALSLAGIITELKQISTEVRVSRIKEEEIAMDGSSSTSGEGQ